MDFDHLHTLLLLFEEGQEKKEYEDLNKKFRLLKTKVLNKEEISDKDDKEFYVIIQTQRKRLIADKCHELKEKIEKRRTKGQQFLNNIKEIDDLKIQGEKEQPTERYDEMFVELTYIEKDIDEKISIEKFQNSQFVMGLILVFALGVVAGIIGNLLYTRFLS